MTIPEAIAETQAFYRAEPATMMRALRYDVAFSNGQAKGTIPWMIEVNSWGLRPYVCYLAFIENPGTVSMPTPESIEPPLPPPTPVKPPAPLPSFVGALTGGKWGEPGHELPTYFAMGSPNLNDLDPYTDPLGRGVFIFHKIPDIGMFSVFFTPKPVPAALKLPPATPTKTF
jgi:hypothetical protein